MAVISGGRYARGVQKLLAIKGETVIPDLDSALQAGIDVQDAAADPAHADSHVLFGWNRYFRPFDVTGDATHVGSAAFGVNMAQGVIAVIERLWALVPAVDLLCQLALESSAGITLSRAVSPFDSRAPKQSVAGIFSSATRNPGGQLIGNVPASAVFGGVALVEVVMPGQPGMVALPGDIWTVYTAAATTRIFGGVWWRERALDPSEATA